MKERLRTSFVETRFGVLHGDKASRESGRLVQPISLLSLCLSLSLSLSSGRSTSYFLAGIHPLLLPICALSGCCTLLSSQNLLSTKETDVEACSFTRVYVRDCVSKQASGHWTCVWVACLTIKNRDGKERRLYHHSTGSRFSVPGVAKISNVVVGCCCCLKNRANQLTLV